MKMTKEYRAARRAVGLPEFERSCRTTQNTTGREALAWKVPGTREHGEHANRVRSAQSYMRRNHPGAAYYA